MARSFYTLGLLFILLLISACRHSSPSSSPNGDTLFARLSPEDTGIDFVNEVHDEEDFNVLTYRNFYNGGGVAIGDINNDGLADIYFTANRLPNKLYLNKGNWKFEDITDKAGVAGEKGWKTGVAMADVNGDGLLDIYVCNSGDIKGDDKENELFINNGDLTFTEKGAEYHLNDIGFSTHASFFDYDLDGDLDCYILNNSFKDPERIDIYKKTRDEKDPYGGDKLLRNDGGVFTDVTSEAGIYNSPIGFGLGVSVSDLNGDMWPDVYISNDFWERDYLYLNQGNGKFNESLTSRISLCSVSSMGADIADLNNDGTYDVFTTDMLAADNYRLKAMTMFDPYHLEDLKYRANFHYQILQNCLQLNNGNADFQELSNLAGVAATDWSWGALIFDFDNDGWKDIFVSNAIYHEIMYLDFTNFINDKDEVKKVVEEKGKFDWRDFAKYMPSNPLPNYAFVNQLATAKTGDSGIPVFVNKSAELGLGEPSFSNGAAYGDLDNDGDLDLVVNNVNMPCFVYRNDANEKSKGHYLKIKLKGKDKNPFGVGAKVEISYAGKSQVLQHFPQRGFESSMEPGLLFGLGNAGQIDQLTVTWPDRKQQVLEHIPADQTIALEQQNADRTFEPASKPAAPVYKDMTQAIVKGDSRHVENTFNDFDFERLLPRMLSTDSPKIIRGDLNGDGQEDFVLTGAAGDADKIFFQQNGSWQRLTTTWESADDIALETTCGAIFDADGDGDNDLLLGAGGNEWNKGPKNFKLRYYDNDGKGNLTKREDKTPPAGGMVSCMLAGDIDGDGDSDLFIGGRAVPGNYGLMPRSFLLRNDGGGRWTDITKRELGDAGMVTDAAFADTDGDGDNDLIVIGDWGPVMHFENINGQFVFSKKQTDKPYLGWWTCLEPADLDGDGDTDFVLGNWGLNTKFKASEEKPITMYVKDFDNNGKSDFIINWYPPLDNTAYPFAGRLDMTQQLPFVKKKALKFEDYAHLTYETMLNDEQRKGALQLKVNWLQNSILWNDKGTFRLQALPAEAQVSTAFGIIVDDLDGDGIKDIWLGGNFYGLKPEVGREDSSKGVYLHGDGKGGFTYWSPLKSGIEVLGEVRDAAVFKTGTGNGILVARNNNAVEFFGPARHSN